MKIIPTCPLGSVCERSTNEGVERCQWYMELVGLHPQTGVEVREWMCAIKAQVIIAMDGNKLTNEMSASVQSHRNEVRLLNKAFNRIPVKICG